MCWKIWLIRLRLNSFQTINRRVWRSWVWVLRTYFEKMYLFSIYIKLKIKGSPSARIPFSPWYMCFFTMTLAYDFRVIKCARKCVLVSDTGYCVVLWKQQYVEESQNVIRVYNAPQQSGTALADHLDTLLNASCITKLAGATLYQSVESLSTAERRDKFPPAEGQCCSVIEYFSSSIFSCGRSCFVIYLSTVLLQKIFSWESYIENVGHTFLMRLHLGWARY